MSDTETPPPEPPQPEPPLAVLVPAPVTPPQPDPEPTTAPKTEAQATPNPEPKHRRSLWPVCLLVSFLVLAAGEGYLWHLVKSVPDNSGAIAALQSQLASSQQTQAAAPAAPAEAAPATPSTAGGAAAPDGIAVQANLAQNLAAVTAQVNAMETQMAADHGTLTTLQANQTDLTKLTAKISLLNRLDSARMALEAGQPLGDISNAPPALAKFATTPPPTQAALVLAFPAAARSAEAASIASNSTGTFWSAVLARLENLVTISNGSHVIIGAPAAGVLTEAQALLSAGDLAGAVAQVQTLSVTTQAAMGDWLTQAQDLLAARAAIITLANQS